MTITAPARPSRRTATTTRRQPQGIPTGGEFAAQSRGEAPDDLLTVTPADETVFTKRYDSPQERIKAITDELAAAAEALDEDDNWNAFLESMSKFHRYSMNNTLLIQMQKPDATRVAGYQAWLKLGRQVKKGEKSISILAPLTFKAKEGKSSSDVDTTKKDDKDEEKKPRRFGGYKTVPVFDISQTEGDPLPELQQSLGEDAPAGFKEDLERLIAETGFTVEYDDIPGSTRGRTYADGSQRVVIQKGLTPGTEAKVLAHELGHIKAGHLDRIDEYHEGHTGCRGQMEVEAESIAFVLCRANGMQSVADISSTYVKAWSGRDADSIKKAGNTVANIVKDLLVNEKWANAVGF